MSQDKRDEIGERLAAEVAKLVERWGRVLAKQPDWFIEDDGFHVMHPKVITQAFSEMSLRALENPGQLIDRQMALWQEIGALWADNAQRFWNGEPPPASEVKPAGKDRRFTDEAWAQNALFDFYKRAYLLSAQRIQEMVDEVPGLDRHTAHKLRFYTRQWVDAMAPSNFALTNPEVLKATIESHGENLVKGMTHMLEDFERNQGRFSVKMTDLTAFRIGENIATTPGKVVFQNQLIQLIQYSPSTPEVRQTPLLIVPPWINKYYILDLKPQNSLVQWAVGQGNTVFLVSWVNPDEKLSSVTFDDYLQEGVLKAIDAIGLATGEKRVNALGFCIGGTLLATTLAYMAAKRDKRVASATFLTSLLDFTDAGDIAVFVDDDQVALIEDHMARKGYFDGQHMAIAFSLLRENDLIWSYVVRNYLLGQEPIPFDLLYWNSDSTRLPPAMHSFYLRNMYLNNRLREPGGIKIGKTAIDLGKITTPAFFLSTREDHIAPWKSTYVGAQLLSGPVRFVLGGSGHIAGVVNPPAAQKYGYWTHDDLSGSPESWLANATQSAGSWWIEWDRWLAGFSGKQVPARQPGTGGLPAIEDAPGAYVKVRLTEV
jgi:polyhydroxyalkanoate synthase